LSELEAFSVKALGKALSQSVHAVTGEAPRFEMCPGLLEIRFYAAQGMTAFAYGADCSPWRMARTNMST